LIQLETLRVCLRELSDVEWQRRVWLAATGPEVSSFEELICQLFDDTGLSDAIDSGRCPAQLTEKSFLEFQRLGRAVRRVDQTAAPADLLEDPRLIEVRARAASVLDILDESSAQP
jgi:hypothetical protein